MDRNQAFARLTAIATVLGDSVQDNGQVRISDKYLGRLQRKPADTIVKIHEELMQRTHKFKDYEMHLLDMFGEIMSELNIEDFTNEPLKDNYLRDFYAQRNAIYNVMGVEEAAKVWGYDNAGTIRNLCNEGKIEAVKVGKTWLISKDHPNPKRYE